MSSDRTTMPRQRRAAELPPELGVAVLFSPDSSVRGRVVRLGPKPLRLGRGPEPPALAFDDPLASRLHASITFDTDRDRHLLVDEGSRNGTRLGGQEIDREVLSVGDILRLGDTVLRFAELSVDLGDWQPDPEGLLRGRSAWLFHTSEQMTRVAPTDLSVLILGETGTGKECVAQEIHRLSARPGPFVPINCAAIPHNLVESELFGHRKGAFSGATSDQQGQLARAAEGTVLLDEVGELPGSSQAKLLRVLEDKRIRPVGAARPEPVDVRFVFATNRDLAAEVQAERFRADLYARMNQWQLALAPLRERPEDLLPIAESLIATHGGGRAYQLSGDVGEAMALHEWPFNVRELVSMLRKALVLLPEGGTIDLAQLAPELPAPPLTAPPPKATPGVPLPPKGAAPTAQELQVLLEHFHGNVADVARHTGRERPQVYRWLRRYDIDPVPFRARRPS